MSEKAIDLYLNDHMGGAMLGADLASQISDRAEDTPLGQTMRGIAAEIEADRDELQSLMEAFGTSRNPAKKLGGWAAEKASRIKFSGTTSGEPDHGLFMALETLRLGVAGKKSLWLALREVRDQHEQLREADLDRLIQRAEHQEQVLESERIRLAGELFAAEPAAVS